MAKFANTVAPIFSKVIKPSRSIVYQPLQNLGDSILIFFLSVTCLAIEAARDIFIRRVGTRTNQTNLNFQWPVIDSFFFEIGVAKSE
jgi:hypothetical protein